MNNKSIDSITEAYKFVNTYKKKIEKCSNKNYKEFDDIVHQVFRNCKVLIPNGKFYRSRIYLEDDKYEKYMQPITKDGFNGYNKQGSFINPKASENRMNKKGDKCLYACSDDITSMLEVLSANDDYVSVSEIKVNEPLIITDLSKSASIGGTAFYCYISVQIQARISEDNHNGNYQFSQYIAKLCKKDGYDGIAYRSKYASISDVYENRGINYAIFNYDKCEAISSDIYQIAKRETVIYHPRTNTIIEKPRLADIKEEFIGDYYERIDSTL